MIDPTIPARAAADTAAWTPRRWWIAPVALLIVFAVLAWQVVAHGPATGVDIRLRDRIQGWAAEPALAWLAPPGRALASLGSQPITLSVLGAVTLLAAWRARRDGRPPWQPVALSAAAVSALATVIPLKILIARPGPGKITLGDAILGFFPSGHTSDALLCYGTSALLLTTWVLRGTLARRATSATTTTLIILVILGLLWSDYHWLSDILGSLAWCGAALLILRRVPGLGGMPPSSASTPGQGRSTRTSR